MSVSPELQQFLLSALTALATGATAGLGLNRRFRRHVLHLSRTVRRQGRQLARHEDLHERAARAQPLAEKRLSWLMGCVFALLAHARIRPHQPLVALDAEATSPQQSR